MKMFFISVKYDNSKEVGLLNIKKVISLILLFICIIPFFVFFYYETIVKKSFDVYHSNKLLELLNMIIFILVLYKKDKLSRYDIIAIIIYLIFISLFPCFIMSREVVLDGPGGGKTILKPFVDLRNIFGISYGWLVN